MSSAAPFFVPAGSTRYNATVFYMPRGLHSAETRALAARLNKPTKESGLDPADRISSLRDLHGQKLLALSKNPSNLLYHYVAEPDKPTAPRVRPSRFQNITRRLSGFSDRVRRRTSSLFARGETRVSQDAIDRATRHRRRQDRAARRRRNSMILRTMYKAAFYGILLKVFLPVVRDGWRFGANTWHAYKIRKELELKMLAIVDTLGWDRFEERVKGTDWEGVLSRAARPH